MEAVSPADWREAARGVPVWAGAHAVDPTTGLVGVVAAIDAFASEARLHSTWLPAERLIVDLSDPDTRAAYDRRLALALGAPIEAVDEGVALYLDPLDGWRHLARCSRSFSVSTSEKCGHSQPQ